MRKQSIEEQKEEKKPVVRDRAKIKWVEITNDPECKDVVIKTIDKHKDEIVGIDNTKSDNEQRTVLEKVFFEYLAVNDYKYVRNYLQMKIQPSLNRWVWIKSTKFFKYNVATVGIYSKKKIDKPDRIFRDKILVDGLLHRNSNVYRTFFSKDCPKSWEAFERWTRKHCSIPEDPALFEKMVNDEMLTYAGKLYVDAEKYEKEKVKIDEGEQNRRGNMKTYQKAGTVTIKNCNIVDKDFFDYFESFVLLEYKPSHEFLSFEEEGKGAFKRLISKPVDMETQIEARDILEFVDKVIEQIGKKNPKQAIILCLARKGHENKAIAKLLNSYDKAKAIQMRLKGYTISEIADSLKFTDDKSDTITAENVATIKCRGVNNLRDIFEKHNRKTSNIKS